MGRGQNEVQLSNPTKAYVARQQYRQIVEASDHLQTAFKALPHSRYITDFLMQSDTADGQYDAYQYEAAYRTSVYLFAAMRRVANLFSRLKIVAEKREGDEWERMPATDPLNVMFSKEGAPFLYRSYMFYAMYGATMIYKRQTLKGRDSYKRGDILWRWDEGGIAGLTVIPNTNWEPVEDTAIDVIRAFDVYRPDLDNDDKGHMRRIPRPLTVYWVDFDPRRMTRGVSMVSLALNDAVTNAAISRWASHYFLSGAMPMLLVMPSADDPALGIEADLEEIKTQTESLWRGLFSPNALRAKFFDHRLDVQEVGITADKVTAPELDRKALNAVASAFQLAPDLIVPPEGGSDNARHKSLIMQAYTDAVLPPAEAFVQVLTHDLGLEEKNIRLVIATEEIDALSADRRDKTETEAGVFREGGQTLGEYQAAIGSDIIEPLSGFVTINGRTQSVDRILRDDRLPSADAATAMSTGWNDGVVRLNEYRAALQLPPDNETDGYKHQVVPEPGGMGGGGFGGGAPSSNTPPSLPDPSPSNQGGDSGEKPDTQGETEADGENGPENAPGDDSDNTDGDKALAVVEQTNPEEERSNPSDVGVIDIEVIDTSTPITEPIFPDDDTEEDAPTPAYVMLGIGDDSLISMVREQLSKALGEDAQHVKWLPPRLWHCTLAAAEHCPRPVLESLHQLIPENIGYFPLRIDGLIVFENDGEDTAICLKVEASDALVNLQSVVTAAMSAMMVQPSEYSYVGNYTPHITLGYFPAGAIASPAMDVHISVVPNALDIGAADYEIIHSIAMGEPDNTPNAVTDRQAWQRAADIERRRMRALVRQWYVSSTIPDGLPQRLQAAIQEVVDEQTGAKDYQVLNAVMASINDGHFDEHSAEEPENPIMRKLLKKLGRYKSTPQEELFKWRRYAMRPRNGAGKAAERFAVRLIPVAIEAYVRDALKALGDGDQRGITEVFNAAEQQLAQETEVPEINEDFLTEWAERMDDLGDEELTGLLEEPAESAD
jgi:2'-5' RNA ligase